jgi:ABC-type bacteriocin/lantibiotic exporter with double-glycine peptidase domain
MGMVTAKQQTHTEARHSIVGLLSVCFFFVACRGPYAALERRVDVVEDDDDSVATLAMILKYYGKKVDTEDIRREVHRTGEEKPSALAVVEAAKHFGLSVRGVQLQGADEFVLLTDPCIAHVTTTKGEFPRSLKGGVDGRYVVIERVSRGRLSIIDPKDGGRRSQSIEKFMETASGVVLLFAGR